LNGSTGLALQNDCPLGDHVPTGHVTKAEADQVTASELRVNRKIEKREVTRIAGQLQPNSN
jgi:hypothetical protein